MTAQRPTSDAAAAAPAAPAPAAPVPVAPAPPGPAPAAPPPAAAPPAAAAPPELRTDVAAADDCAYAGLATRALALAVDAAVVNGIALLVGVVVGLGLSLFDIHSKAKTILVVVGAMLAVLWTIAYFVVFWTANGQTPGNRLLEIRVQDADTGRPVGHRRALLRILLLDLSALVLFTPALTMLFDVRRRALHDVLAGTVVVYAPRADDPPRPGPRPPNR